MKLLVPHIRASHSGTCRYQGLTTSTLLRHMYVNKAHLLTLYVSGYVDQRDVHSIIMPVMELHYMDIVDLTLM